MRLDITYKMENPQFDKQYADEYHFGKESDGNRRYDLDEGYSISNVERFEIRKNTTRIIDGSYEIPNVNTLVCSLNDGTQVEASISKSILQKIQETPSPKYGVTRIYFYLKPASNIVQYRDLNFFEKSDFPNDFVM